MTEHISPGIPLEITQQIINESLLAVEVKIRTKCTRPVRCLLEKVVAVSTLNETSTADFELLTTASCADIDCSLKPEVLEALAEPIIIETAGMFGYGNTYIRGQDS